jgi:hypothetical protein
VYQWEEFFLRNKNPTTAAIEAFRDDLRSVTSDFTKTADEIDWPFNKPQQ